MSNNTCVTYSPSSVCSDHGTCMTDGTCVCHNGWSGTHDFMSFPTMDCHSPITLLTVIWSILLIVRLLGLPHLMYKLIRVIIDGRRVRLHQQQYGIGHSNRSYRGICMGMNIFLLQVYFLMTMEHILLILLTAFHLTNGSEHQRAIIGHSISGTLMFAGWNGCWGMCAYLMNDHRLHACLQLITFDTKRTAATENIIRSLHTHFRWTKLFSVATDVAPLLFFFIDQQTATITLFVVWSLAMIKDSVVAQVVATQLLTVLSQASLSSSRGGNPTSNVVAQSPAHKKYISSFPSPSVPIVHDQNGLATTPLPTSTDPVGHAALPTTLSDTTVTINGTSTAASVNAANNKNVSLAKDKLLEYRRQGRAVLMSPLLFLVCVCWPLLRVQLGTILWCLIVAIFTPVQWQLILQLHRYRRQPTPVVSSKQAKQTSKINNNNNNNTNNSINGNGRAVPSSPVLQLSTNIITPSARHAWSK